MAAITTRYAGPTNTRGGRILVRSDEARSVVPWDASLSAFDNHVRAAAEHAERHDLGAVVSSDYLPGDGGIVHITRRRS